MNGTEVFMVIQIERISAQGNRRLSDRCVAPRCVAAPTWFLVDLDMPDINDANMGERPCCTAHIAATYLGLRGAHLIAQALPPGTGDTRPRAHRLRRNKLLSISSMAGD